MRSFRKGPSARRLLSLVGATLIVSANAFAAGSEPMMTAGLTSQPIGHFEFCKTHLAECSIRTPDKGVQSLSDTVLQEIEAINTEVNHSVRPMNDVDIYGKDEVWAYPGGVGDCEDYVLEKRRDLMRQGLSLSNLLITVVRKPDGEGHAVLTVRTNKGDFVLDNLTDTVRLWDLTGYRFLKRQASNHTGRWVTIRDSQPAAPLVGSVK